MAIDFEAEVARMHAGIDDVVGVDAMFRPAASAPVTCKVERFRPEPEFGLEHAKTVVADELLRLSRSALPVRPQRGDVFDLLAADGVTVTARLRVLATPTVEDDDGLRWTVKVEAA